MNKAAPVARVEPEPERKPDVAEPIAKLTELKDAMCKCTDKACAETTQAELVAYGQSVAGRTEKPDQATIDKAMVLMTDYQACAEKLLGTP